jgi:uncharacterized protein YbcI
MSLELAEAAVIVSLRGNMLAAEACSADAAEEARRLAVERCELLCVRYVHDMKTALLAAGDIHGTELVEVPSRQDIRAWVNLQLDDSTDEARELREHADGGDGDGGSLVLA